MVDIVATPEWKSVRILERDEVALGGYGGNMNEQATALVARTELLMQEKANTSDIVQGQYSFTTLAEFDSKKATIPANSVVIIDEAGANQGTNTWDGTNLIKSAYDPLTQAKADATIKSNLAKDIAISRFKGLYDIFKDASKINDKALSLTGNLVDLVGTKTTDYIPVMSGDVLGIRTRSQTGEPIIVAYKADKSFHSVLATKTTASTEYDINDITISSGIAYLRISYFTAVELNCYIKKSC